MSNIVTSTIAITKEPEAQSLKQKLQPGSASPELLSMHNVVLEYTRTKDEMRSMLFLALYLPSNMVAAFGGTETIAPKMRSDDVLGEHGIRLNFQQLDTQRGELGFEGMEKTPLSENEMNVIRSALRQLLSENADT